AESATGVWDLAVAMPDMSEAKISWETTATICVGLVTAVADPTKRIDNFCLFISL
ncbi:hypothetical protein A2U01_0116310, partial [Trifolium medium]|nr:hypothetical protein [Trifolium medium]